MVEGNGIPVGLAVDGANRPDMKMVEETLASIPVERPDPDAEGKPNLCDRRQSTFPLSDN